VKNDRGIGLFSAGEIRRTLLLALVKDAAEGRQPALDTVQRFMEHPLLEGGVDCEFLRKFLDETNANPDGMRSRIVLDYAELAYQLVRPKCRELAPDSLGVLVTWAINSGSLERAVPYAREGLKDFADAGPELLAAWRLCLGHEAYGRRSFREASVHYEQALVHNRAARDVRQELDNLTSLAACHTFLRNELEAIQCAARAEQIARDLGDLDALTKALGDQGNAEFRLERMERARTFFEAALDAAERGGNKQRQSDWSGMLGNVSAGLGDFDKAEACHRRALALSLETGSLESEQADHHNLAAVLWIRERHDESIDHETAALRLAEKRADTEQVAAYRRTLQERYIELGLYEKAFALQQLAQPEDADSEDGAADDAHRDPAAERQRHALASEAAAQQAPAQPKEPDAESLWEREFLAAVRDGEAGRAKKMSDDYISEHPDRATGYFHLGLFLNETGQYEESIAAYNEALARDPQLVVAHYNRLNSYIAMRDLETPVRLYEQQRSDSPLDPTPRMMLGRIAILRGDLNTGVRELREAHRLAPQDFTVHSALCDGLLNLAISLLRDDFDGAWSVYELCADELASLIKEHPTMKADAYILAAECHEKMAMESHFQQPPLSLEFGDAELQVLGYALNYFRRAGEMAPHRQRPREGFDRVAQILIEFPKAAELTRVARVLREADLREEALLFLTLSLRENERLAGTHYELGLLGIDQARAEPEGIAEARKHIERALQLDPGNQEYLATLRRLGQPHHP
jgi:tetratricopeptide (TPR) repeat protein